MRNFSKLALLKPRKPKARLKMKPLTPNPAKSRLKKAKMKNFASKFVARIPKR